MNFEKRWLAESLIKAAKHAGYAKWWLADHVVESVSSYLENEFDENVVTSVRLEKAVRSVLQVIGYADVATCFRSAPPPARLSLAEVAREAGNGYELIFFELLRAKLREMLSVPVEKVQFVELRGCVKILRSAKYWGRDCNGLSQEIVEFIRGEVSSSAKNLSVQLS